jgi:hypothetical protein
MRIPHFLQLGLMLRRPLAHQTFGALREFAFDLLQCLNREAPTCSP